MTPPKLTGVYRLDSLPLTKAYYTSEGYLVDRPIVTSTGIFEYHNPDGSVRRELRLPEDVFDPESLKSYKGKPIIITHDAGLITKDNVGEEQVGTILTEGYRSGDNVRAEIIIHDTDEMKSAGLKELSLGYNLDLDETPGEWNGKPYDAIQRNIRINHLALVMEARAGEQARLNIDSRDRKSTSKGGSKMKKKKTHRGDGLLSPEELKKAVAEYKSRRAQRMSESNEDADDATAVENAPDVEIEEPVTENTDGDSTPTSPESDAAAQVEALREKRDRRDQEGDPKNKEAAMGVIAQQDEDIGILFDIIDTLLAKMDFDGADAEGIPTDGAENEDCGGKRRDADDEPAPEEDTPDFENTDGDDEELENEDCGGKNCDSDEDELDDPENEDEDDFEEENEDEDDESDDDEDDLDNEDTEDEEPETIPTVETDCGGSKGSKMNADSIDRIVRQRIQLGMLGRKLNMDGLENMSIMAAKKRIIKAVRPSLRLDGKSQTYVDAIFSMTVSDINASTQKDTGYQKRQMFNKDTAVKETKQRTSANSARQRMIKRLKKKKEVK